MQCNLCRNNSSYIFSEKVLYRYKVAYFKCDYCGFIQTEPPYWLDEAYRDEVACLDVGLVSRNISLSKLTERIITDRFDVNGKFVDYGGGYGLFVRLMRDKGFDFYRHDPIAKNIFSNHFDIGDLSQDAKFEILTAFEVFEHLCEPFVDIAKMFELSDNILFTTELQPDSGIHSLLDWWYFVPESGQHVSFYTIKSLKSIADKFRANYFTNEINLHLFSKKLTDFEFNKRSFCERVTGNVKRFYLGRQKRESLIWSDFNYIRKIIVSGK
jgi:hypothetical protein